MCSCGIAVQTLMLTAKAMGYDYWRLEAFDTEGIGRLINLPSYDLVAMPRRWRKHQAVLRPRARARFKTWSSWINSNKPDSNHSQVLTAALPLQPHRMPKHGRGVPTGGSPCYRGRWPHPLPHTPIPQSLR